jgi:hypothetical protein
VGVIRVDMKADRIRKHIIVLAERCIQSVDRP